MKQQLKIVVNGEPYDLFVEPKTLLVQVIREMLGLKGTHQACDSSSCAACTVILDGMAVKSCSVLALQANGKEVLTIEGWLMAPNCIRYSRRSSTTGRSNAVSAPGQIMAAKALLDENPNSTREEIQGRWMVISAVAPGT